MDNFLKKDSYLQPQVEITELRGQLIICQSDGIGVTNPFDGVEENVL